MHRSHAELQERHLDLIFDPLALEHSLDVWRDLLIGFTADHLGDRAAGDFSGVKPKRRGVSSIDELETAVAGAMSDRHRRLIQHEAHLLFATLEFQKAFVLFDAHRVGSSGESVSVGNWRAHCTTVRKWMKPKD